MCYNTKSNYRFYYRINLLWFFFIIIIISLNISGADAILVFDN